ncbi:MAG: Uma2 family endonuclease [Rhodopirellula sp.]|nr:Uma2 family endonuclease [Rhodopirellula sp.]
MATSTATNGPLLTLPPELRPNVDHLVTEDDAPLDNVFSEKQQRLLTEPLYSSWSDPAQNRPFVAMANVGLFWSVRRPPYVPDALLSVDVELSADLWPKAHRSYFIWDYGKAPDIVIEVVSNRQGSEDTEKLAGYARVGVRYYAIFDPGKLLDEEVLRVYRLEGLALQKMEGPAWFPDIGLGLEIWQGRYEDHDNTWLRWVDPEGRLIPSGRERAESERQRAESEHQRAERLAAQLRQLGIEPQEP